MSLQWLKVLHLVFVVSWFAGLLYLPRLFVYHAQDQYRDSFALLQIMEKRLFVLMTIAATLATAFGLLALLSNPDYYFQQAWMHWKLLLVGALFIYHYWCWRHLQALKQGTSQYTHKWFRWFNETPVLALVGILILVLVKPGL